MVEQVNRLISNLLAAGGEVYLPEVGSLSSERVPAKRISKKEVIPPHRTVTYTSQPRGASLIDEIARVIRNATPDADADAKAREVYSRWLSRVRENETLTIEGIGILNAKHFTVDEAFDRRLNPQGYAPVHIPQRGGFDWSMGVGIFAAVAVCGCVIYWWFTQNTGIQTSKTAVAETEVAVVETQPEIAAEAADTTATASVAAPTVEPEKITEPAEPAVDPKVPVRMTKGHCYVVLGVYSTTANAVRALESAKTQLGFDCRIYRYGEKFVVSPFEADNTAACDKFINDNTARQEGMWRHLAR